MRSSRGELISQSRSSRLRVGRLAAAGNLFSKLPVASSRYAEGEVRATRFGYCVSAQRFVWGGRARRLHAGGLVRRGIPGPVAGEVAGGRRQSTIAIAGMQQRADDAARGGGDRDGRASRSDISVG